MIECGQAVDKDSSNTRASELITASVDRARSAIDKYEVESEGKGQKRRMIAGCVPPLTECYFANKVPSSIEDLIPEYTVILTTLLKSCKVDVLLRKHYRLHERQLQSSDPYPVYNNNNNNR